MQMWQNIEIAKEKLNTVHDKKHLVPWGKAIQRKSTFTGYKLRKSGNPIFWGEICCTCYILNMNYSCLNKIVQMSSSLGPFHNTSQGQCSTQIKHSYWCKSWNQPQGLYARSQGWTRKNLFNQPKVTNKCWTLWPCIGPQGWKEGYHQIWEANACNPWGQCSSIY
jgi:hypothetical protein